MLEWTVRGLLDRLYCVLFSLNALYQGYIRRLQQRQAAARRLRLRPLFARDRRVSGDDRRERVLKKPPTIWPSPFAERFARVSHFAFPF